ncbi:endo-alpha-N-acetylgalactosaminidase family protein [Kitasatospora sp. NPDC051984]|uniref:endo-alpha-N-acetylgalactosaminidase family protein n=1 Tax=Kitasatospora sp. NPDC051984 TaxID=3364059 RepID=UPI0037CBABBC
MPKPHTSRAGAALLSTSLLLLGATPTTAAQAAVPATRTATISSGSLSATVDTAFPQVLQYRLGTGTLPGNTGATPRVSINGTAYTPGVSSVVAADHVDYTLGFTSIGVTLHVRVSVSGPVLDWKVTGVTETRSTKVTTLAIPGQNLLSVRGDQTGSQLADAALCNSLNAVGSGNPPGPDTDTIGAVSSLPADSAPRHKAVALVATSTIAAGVTSNSLTTFGDPVAPDCGGNLLVQTTVSGGVNTTAIGSDLWTYRGPDGQVVALPEEKVVLTGDVNGSGSVDWQDAAVAYRQIMPEPAQAAETKNNVVSQISMNFVSQAQNPFLKTLDDIKKTALYTDGLGQAVELKGYQDEGHDAGHPDYAGHYNTAAGGLADINTLVDAARAYNTIVGVHISDVGAAPRSHAFRWDRTTNPTSPGSPYIWGDTAYNLDTSKDLAGGDYASRIDALVHDIPHLGFVYSDAFVNREDVDWNAWKEADAVTKHGLPIYTEWAAFMFPYASWYHTSNERTDTGINSTILRFLYNQDMDAWVNSSQPMLGGEQNKAGFMGYHSNNSVPQEIAEVFTNNLPTKYLQNFRITGWQPGAIQFTGGVSTTMNGATPQIWRDGALERDGNKLFLPWSPQGQQKIYAWDDTAESRTWTLPKAWSGQSTVTLYKLSDTGKDAGTKLTVSGGRITLDLDADTPYVIYPGTPVAATTAGSLADGSNTGTPVLRTDTASSVAFGSGAIVKNGEFFTRDLSGWTPSSASGDTSGLSVVTDANGFQNLRISGTGDGQVTQQLTGLTPGQTYSASAYVSVTGTRKATLRIDGNGATPVGNWIDRPTPVQTDADNRFSGQRFQRLEVLFTQPAGATTATLHLMAAGATNADDAVLWSDVRAMADPGATHQADGHFYTEDFEHNTGGGFGPFLIGKPGEPSEILSEFHDGYTRDTISGNYSLETINNGSGLQFRTWPGSIRFVPGHSYRVQADYQSDTASQYHFQVGADSAGAPITDVTLNRTTTQPLTGAPAPGPVPSWWTGSWTDSLPPQRSAPSGHIDTSFTAGDCGDAYLALTAATGNSGAATLDNLVVDDLGATATGLPTCPVPTSGPIVGAASHRCVDIPGSDSTNGTGIDLWDCNGGANQTWTFPGDGTIRSLGKCLDVAGHGTTNGTRVALWDCNGGANQQWTYDSATGTFTGAESGLCLDATDAATDNGTPLEIWSRTGGANQQWTHP